MPFARSHSTDVLQAIDFIVERNYSARSEAWSHNVYIS